MALRQAWLDALRPVPGSLRLVGLRWMLWLLSAIPGTTVAMRVLGSGIGRSPHYAEAPDPFPFFTVLGWLDGVPGSVWAVFAVGALLAWAGNLMLTAAAVEILQPARVGRVRVWRSFFDTGTRHLWCFLRIALVAFVFLVLGFRVIALIAESVNEHGVVAGWSAARLRWTLPLARFSLVAGWGTLVGLLAWWCRVIAVADGRRFMRRLPTLALRAWRRAPLQGVVLQVALAVTGMLAGGVVLYAWRQSSAGTGPWLLLWLGVLALQSWLWHWRLRTCCLLWADPVFDGARSIPDAPWGWLRRLLRRARPATSPGPGSDPAPR